MRRLSCFILLLVVACGHDQDHTSVTRDEVLIALFDNPNQYEVIRKLAKLDRLGH